MCPRRRSARHGCYVCDTASFSSKTPHCSVMAVLIAVIAAVPNMFIAESTIMLTCSQMLRPGSQPMDPSRRSPSRPTLGLIRTASLIILKAPFIFPVQVGHFTVEPNWKPHVVRNRRIWVSTYPRHVFCVGHRAAAEDCSEQCHSVRPTNLTLRQPPIGQGDVQVLLVRVLEHRADLGAKRGAGGIVGMRATQDGPGTVIRSRACNLGGVGIIPGGARSEQIVQPSTVEIGRGLAHIGRMRVRKVRGVVPCDIGVVSGEVGADQLAVHALEVVVGLAVAWLDN